MSGADDRFARLQRQRLLQVIERLERELEARLWKRLILRMERKVATKRRKVVER